jgi:hypothetical protein
MYTVQVVITTKHFSSCSPKGTLVTLCVNKLKKPLQSAKLCKKAQWLCNGFFMCFILIFFHSAFANTLPSLKASSNKEKVNLTQVDAIATRPIVKVATPSAIASPKLKLSTQISSNLQHDTLNDKQRSPNSMSVAVDSINVSEITNIASNAAIVEHHNSSQLNDVSAKKSVENRWQEENKWLIAFILIFATAITIIFVLAKYK